jgi:hypothetical protein
MSLTVFCLLALAIALIFLIEVVLGYPSSDSLKKKSRLTLREFMTGLLPLFLFGIGVASLMSTPWAGALLILLSAGLWIYKYKTKS